MAEAAPVSITFTADLSAARKQYDDFVAQVQRGVVVPITGATDGGARGLPATFGSASPGGSPSVSPWTSAVNGGGSQGAFISATNQLTAALTALPDRIAASILQALGGSGTGGNSAAGQARGIAGAAGSGGSFFGGLGSFGRLFSGLAITRDVIMELDAARRFQTSQWTSDNPFEVDRQRARYAGGEGRSFPRRIAGAFENLVGDVFGVDSPGKREQSASLREYTYRTNVQSQDREFQTQAASSLRGAWRLGDHATQLQSIQNRADFEQLKIQREIDETWDLIIKKGTGYVTRQGDALAGDLPFLQDAPNDIQDAFQSLQKKYRSLNHAYYGVGAQRDFDIRTSNLDYARNVIGQQGENQGLLETLNRNPLAAQLAPVQARLASAMLAPVGSPEHVQGVVSAMLQGGVIQQQHADQLRGIQIGQAGSAAQTMALLRRDPLGAQVAGIQAGTASRADDLYRRGYIAEGAAEEAALPARIALVHQQHNDAIRSINNEQEGRVEEMGRLGQLDPIGAQASRIKTQTQARATELYNSGFKDQAMHQFSIGDQELRLLRQQYLNAFEPVQIGRFDFLGNSPGRGSADFTLGNLGRDLVDLNKRKLGLFGGQNGDADLPPADSGAASAEKVTNKLDDILKALQNIAGMIQN